MEKNTASYRVIYGDTDQMGVVYYANYLRWFEMGRTELLRQVGLPYTLVEEKGLRFPVVEISCRYHAPARYDDTILVETTLTEVGRATIVFHYRILRQGDNLTVASGWTKHACVDQEGKLTKIPAAMETLLKAALSGAGERNP